MRRRDFLHLAAVAVGLRSVPGGAQTAQPTVIGYLSGRSAGDTSALLAAFYQGLAENGYIVGQNLAIAFSWAEGHYDRFPELAEDLVRRKVDLIVAAGGATAARAAKAETATIPIVFFSGGDPVRDGLVASLARPGGNLTGVSLELAELAPKRLEILAELVPRARIIVLLVNPDNANADRVIHDAEAAARAMRLQLPVLKASTAGEIDSVAGKLIALRGDAVLVGDDPFFSQRREQLVALTAHTALPAIYPQREFVADGGLASYAPSFVDAQRLLGIYCGRILKGAKPANLPVQQPTRLKLVINLKTATALGLTVPPSLLARADEVIE